jgi:deoxyadenosine/deoxycytidine kinase
MSSYRYIAVEGNIGVGKSTLAAMLAKHYNARFIAEEFADNNFLPKFYNDPVRYAFPLELSFLADRYKQMKNMPPSLFDEKLIADYVFTKSKLFARINLDDAEYELFQNLFDIINTSLPAPDLLIYLQAPISKLQQNIKKRGREYEQSIPDKYLENVQGIYEQFLKEYPGKCVVIDTTDIDLLNNRAHFSSLVSFIDNNNFTNRQYWQP